MFNLSDISFQPKPASASTSTSASETTTDSSSTSSSSKGLFSTVLGESKETNLAKSSTSTTTTKTTANATAADTSSTSPDIESKTAESTATTTNENNEVEAVESDESDQKIIHLEEIDSTEMSEETIELSDDEIKSDTTEQIIAENPTTKVSNNTINGTNEDTVTNLDLDNQDAAELANQDALNLESQDVVELESQDALDLGSQGGLDLETVKASDQEAIETSSRSASVSELNNAKLESTPSRQKSPLSSVTGATNPLADKAIDINSPSVKMADSNAVEFEEPVVTDKFEVDNKLAAHNGKFEGAEAKSELLLSSGKDVLVGLDSKVIKGAAVTPINVQSVNGHFDLSGLAANAVKTDAALPVTTLALRQPGVDQSLATNISFMIKEDMQSANINVKPAELGPVSVQLAVRSDHLSVTIAASQVQTRETLESTLPRLREHFASLGFSTVDVNVGEHQSQRQSNGDMSGNGSGTPTNGYFTGEVEVEDAGYVVSNSVTHNGMVDTFA